MHLLRVCRFYRHKIKKSPKTVSCLEKWPLENRCTDRWIRWWRQIYSRK